MPESDAVFWTRQVIGILFTIGSTILVYYIIKRYHGKKSIQEPEIYLVLENTMIKSLVYSGIIMYFFFLFVVIYVEFIQTHMKSYGVPWVALLGFTAITAIAIMVAWSKKITYDGKTLTKKNLWARKYSGDIYGIDEIYVTGSGSTVIKFNDGMEMKIPDFYTNAQDLIDDLKEKIPATKWDLSVNVD